MISIKVKELVKNNPTKNFEEKLIMLSQSNMKPRSNIFIYNNLYFI